MTYLVRQDGGTIGNFFALNAETGKPLWDTQLGGNIRGIPVSFAVDGKQYVAIAGGFALFVFECRGPRSDHANVPRGESLGTVRRLEVRRSDRSHLRCVGRRPALPDDQGRSSRRRDGRVADDDDRAELVGRVEDAGALTFLRSHASMNSLRAGSSCR